MRVRTQRFRKLLNPQWVMIIDAEISRFLELKGSRERTIGAQCRTYAGTDLLESQAWRERLQYVTRSGANKPEKGFLHYTTEKKCSTVIIDISTSVQTDLLRKELLENSWRFSSQKDTEQPLKAKDHFVQKGQIWSDEKNRGFTAYHIEGK